MVSSCVVVTPAFPLLFSLQSMGLIRSGKLSLVNTVYFLVPESVYPSFDDLVDLLCEAEDFTER
jgi:hypothetical protein